MIQLNKQGLFQAAHNLKQASAISFSDALKSVYAVNNVNVFKDALREGKVAFKFAKKDGSMRVAIGTLAPEFVPEGSVKGTEKETTKEKIEAKVIRYWDLGVRDWRACRIGSIVEVYMK